MGCAAGGHPGATSRSTDSHLLLNKTWQWEATMTPAETISVSDPDRYTIRFLADGQLQARFDCNRGGGSYTISAGSCPSGR
jgi:heat shock protein HslJ